MKMWYKSSFTRHCRQIKVTHNCVYSQKCGRVCLRPTAVNYWQGPGTSQENEDMEKTSEWQGTTKHISPSPNSIYATRQLVDTCLWNNSGKCLRGKWMSTRARQIPKNFIRPSKYLPAGQNILHGNLFVKKTNTLVFLETDRALNKHPGHQNTEIREAMALRFI